MGVLAVAKARQTRISALHHRPRLEAERKTSKFSGVSALSGQFLSLSRLLGLKEA
jgi:hypothetical protein